MECSQPELNRRHADFQSTALPTELQEHIVKRRFRNRTSPQSILTRASPRGALVPWEGVEPPQTEAKGFTVPPYLADR